MRFFFIFFCFTLSSCLNLGSYKFKKYLVGDWRIENPTLQSFVTFEENGRITYYFNRYTYELDSLAEIGQWKIDEIKKGKSIDTFIVTVDKKPQKTTFKMIAFDKDKLKVVDDQGHVFFTRINN